MIVLYKIYLRDRKTMKISWFTHCKFWVDDIEQGKIDLMIDISDPDYECINVKLIEIFSFT